MFWFFILLFFLAIIDTADLADRLSTPEDVAARELHRQQRASEKQKARLARLQAQQRTGRSWIFFV